MPTDAKALFEVRAERDDRSATKWSWAIYRIGAPAPFRRSMPMFATDIEAFEAGAQVMAALRERASLSRFVPPGL